MVSRNEDVEAIREMFLDMLADCKWSIDYDTYTNEMGQRIDCSTFSIAGSYKVLEAFCEVFGIRATRDSSLDNEIHKAIEEPGGKRPPGW